jgi:hypothetical protein
MSKSMIHNFFPAFEDSLNNSWFGSILYNDWLFPDSVAQACPEITITLFGFRLRQPILAVAALWGILLGVNGSIRLYRHKSNNYWSMAFLTFGMMNVSAMFLHCIWSEPVPDYPRAHPWLWAIDCYMTGFSSICLLVASLEAMLLQIKGRKLLVVQLAWFFGGMQSIGLGCLLWFLLANDDSMVALTHPLELWYLVPPALAAIPVNRLLFHDMYTHESFFGMTMGHVLALLGGISAAVLGVGMDRLWCTIGLGHMFWDLFTSSTLMFVGCDLAFLGIQLCLLTRKQSNQIRKQV